MDRPLLKLERGIDALLSRLSETRDDGKIEQIRQEIENLDAQINATPATSPIGLRVKIRRLWHGLSEGQTDRYIGCYQSLARDLDHLEAIWPPEVLQLSDSLAEPEQQQGSGVLGGGRDG